MKRASRIGVLFGVFLLWGGLAPSDASATLGVVGPAPAWAAADYDGKTFSTDQADLAPANVLPTVHVVYLYAGDRSSQFATYAAKFQRDARFASSILQTLFGRGLRFDERLGNDGRRYVDITNLQSRYGSKQLSGSKQFSDALSDLRQTGFSNPNKKYLVFLDATSPYCGQSQATGTTTRSPSNGFENTSVSVIYQCQATNTIDSNGQPTGGWGNYRTALHELSHAMGAVLSAAPHFVAGSHCNDNANDVMCVFASTVPYSGGLLYDAGEDDYWDPAADPASGSSRKLPWWTVNLSRFICPMAGCDSPNSSPGY